MDLIRLKFCVFSRYFDLVFGSFLVGVFRHIRVFNTFVILQTDHRIFDSTPTTSAAEVNKGDIEDRQTDKVRVRIFIYIQDVFFRFSRLMFCLFFLVPSFLALTSWEPEAFSFLSRFNTHVHVNDPLPRLFQCSSSIYSVLTLFSVDNHESIFVHLDMNFVMVKMFEPLYGLRCDDSH